MAMRDTLKHASNQAYEPVKPASANSGKESRILVLGASGFIGSSVVASIAGSDKAHVAGLSRQPPGGHRILHAAAVQGDITVPESLAVALQGVDVVVHSASYVGSDPRLAHETNELGTRNVIEECRRAGVGRIIYVSTAAVYGSGPHRGLSEDEAEYHPASVASGSRAHAERLVLHSGGEVVRPNLVFGRGDRWVIPGLLKMMAAAGRWPGDGSALLSVVDVADLGRLVGGLALSRPQPGQAFHAAYPEPITISRLLRTIAKAFNAAEPQYSPHGDEHSPHRDHASLALEQSGFSRHQIDMVTLDHWYRSDRLWTVAGLTPPAPAARLKGLSAAYPHLLPPDPPTWPATGPGEG